MSSFSECSNRDLSKPTSFGVTTAISPSFNEIYSLVWRTKAKTDPQLQGDAD
jgi:hypothetical protein